MNKLAYLMAATGAVVLVTATVSHAKDEQKPAAPEANKKATPEARPAPAADKAAPAPETEKKAAPDAEKKAAPEAEKKAAPEAEKKAAPEAPVARPEPPRPAPEIADMLGAQQGTWRCTGSASGPDGKPAKLVATMTTKADLDKFWIVSTLATKKTKENPVVYRSTTYTTYDAAAKRWVRVAVDNMGGWEQTWSTAVNGPAVAWQGKRTGMGFLLSTKHYEEMKGTRELELSGTMSQDGKIWQPMYDLVCKK